ncbi:MAG: hypothetical protein MPJ50_04280 [Pirellulales bacterium]|nr:hypothetical protein [Pirellulales bacterium]
MTTRVIVQARMGSHRLPGKISRPLAGRSLLSRVLERLRQCKEHLDETQQQTLQFVVATTMDLADDWTVRECRRMGVTFFRGSSEDVLARYLAASADLHPNDIVIRATADNPFYCPLRTAAVIRRHRGSRTDYTCVRGLSYVVPEVMRVGALRQMGQVARDPECREHVTSYFRREVSQGQFRVEQLPLRWRGLRPEIRLTIDTPAEYQAAQRLYDHLAVSRQAFPLEDVYRYLDEQHGARRAA